MREGQRSDVYNCFEKVTAATGDSPEVHLTILDGAVVIQMASPEAAKTFQEYVDNVFMPYIHNNNNYTNNNNNNNLSIIIII